MKPDIRKLTAGKRTITLRDLMKFNPVPKKHCRWCGKRCPGRRYHWCSDECLHEFYYLRDPRGRIQERDHGICSECGLDCIAIEEAIRDMRLAYRRKADHGRHKGEMMSDYYGWGDSGIGGWRRSEAFWSFIKGLRISRKVFDRSLWAVDHILPVAEGGSLHPDNLRTLCIWCHKKITKKWHGKRKK